MSVMINVVNLTQHYGVRPVLRDFSLQVESGDVVVVMGPNGSGKSTLLAAMAGMLSPQKGYIEIDSLRRKSSEEAELMIRQKVFYLPYAPWLPTTSTGRDFLLAVGRLYHVDYDRMFDHIERLTPLFDLNEKIDAPISSYSTGQQKKISICSALISDAPILLLDEPFSGGLDPSALIALKGVLHALARRSDVTAVITTPVPQIVEEIAERIAILQDGRLTAYDTPQGLRHLGGDTATLQEALEHLMSPETGTNLKHYVERLRP